MEKLTINLVPFIGQRGAEVSVSNVLGHETALVGGQQWTAREALAKSAQLLREAAARLDLLATEEDPFSISTQDRVNALEIPTSAPTPVEAPAKAAKKGGRK